MAGYISRDVSQVVYTSCLYVSISCFLTAAPEFPFFMKTSWYVKFQCDVLHWCELIVMHVSANSCYINYEDLYVDSYMHASLS